MTRVVRTSPSGTLTAYRPDGTIAGEFGYADMTMTVDEEIEGGDKPVEFEVRKDVGDGILLLDTDEMRGRVLAADDPERQCWPRMEVGFKPGGEVLVRDTAGRFVPIDDAGSKEWRRRPKRSEVLSFSSGRQDSPIENRRQRRARVSKNRRSR